jgi:hypothetical protein
VVASEYTDISDGASVLHIDRTHVTFVRPNQEFSIGYFFKDVETGEIDNSFMGSSYSQTEGEEVFNPSIYVGGGFITGRTAATLPQNEFYESTITIAKGGLERTVTLRLREPMDFAVSTTPGGGVVPNVAGSEASIHFSFPDDISPELFPIPVRIHTRKFTPLPDQGLTLEYGNGDYWYVYNAPWNGVDAVHTIEMASIARDTEETVRLSSDLFNDNYEAVFYNALPPEFGNPTINPKPRNTNTTTDMRVSFAMPEDTEYPVTATFTAPNLALRNGGRTQGLNLTPAGGNNADNRRFTMTINSAGDYYFTVRNVQGEGNNDGVMRLSADGFTTTGNLND